MKSTSLRGAFLRGLPRDELLALFDLLPDVSFFLKDRAGRFVALNRKGCDFCGVSDEGEALGKTDADFFPADRAAAYQMDDRAVMESGKPILNRVEAAPESIRSPRLVITSKVPLRDRRGKVIGVAGFSRLAEKIRESSGVSRFGKVVDYLHENYAGPISTPDLARRAGLSTSQFDRRFRQVFGTSPRQYLLRVRVEAAARLLIDSDGTVAAIAQECGFHDHAHLSRSFRRMMHCTPSTYRGRVGSG